ncbi:hypothetical protein AA313_de0209705 [Arthrobotrys entomopaga]|nr:hypothetical protein AA313_de0209705 [Arthrobotrys entomopaga]
MDKLGDYGVPGVAYKEIVRTNPNGPKVFIDLDAAGTMISEAVEAYNETNTTLCAMPGGSDPQWWPNPYAVMDGTPVDVSPNYPTDYIAELKLDGTAFNASKVAYCKNRYSIRMYNLRNSQFGSRQTVPVFCKDVMIIAQALFNITQREFKAWHASNYTIDVDHRSYSGDDPSSPWPPLDPETNLPIDIRNIDTTFWWSFIDAPPDTRIYAESDWSSDQTWGVFLSYELYGCPEPTGSSKDMVPLEDSTLVW